MKTNKIKIQCAYEKSNSFLQEHLNVAWFRPESALWATIASTLISNYKIISPSLDLGCGNGIFSFITAGGSFSSDYDWYINADPGANDGDIYDIFKCNEISKYIIKKPLYSFTFGLDHKENLLKQAEALNFYKKLICHDANKSLPFGNGELATIFSNIAYWLRQPQRPLREIHRILRKNGTAILCMPSSNFLRKSFTYCWRQKKSELLRLLNGGRSEHIHWTISFEDFSALVKEIGFEIIGHKYYISPLILRIWDIGLRPISPVLIKMANSLTKERRRQIKSEWIKIITGFLLPLLDLERESQKKGVFHFFILKK
ncbi:MAG: methyltransferase domain-containing protein [Candidatus Omnitrophota bacterium]|nr:methyltransferase domain-containing protein [Candidatus Omnitrophota bacterium]